MPWYARVGKRISALTVRSASVCIERVKLLAFLLLVFVLIGSTSCTTLVNRRDLYSPEPAPDSLEAARQWVRRHDHKHDDDNPNTKSSGRDRGPRTFVTRDQTESSDYGCCRAGITHAKDSQAEKPARRIRKGCLSYVLTERKIRLYPRHICVVDARCFGQPAFALCALRRQQMASPRNATSKPFRGQ